MSRTEAEPNSLREHIANVPELKGEMELRCKQCGRSGKYRVGRVLIDGEPDASSPDKHRSFEETVSFTGILHCWNCGSCGPWEFPVWTMLRIAAHVLTPKPGPSRQIPCGRLQLYDGTMVRSGAEAEAYIKSRLEQSPGDAYVWGRLGNLYTHAGDPERARDAYQRAVELDPAEFESNFNLGCYYAHGREFSQAAECFQRVLRYARTVPARNAELLPQLIRGSLEWLFELHQETDGEIPFPPRELPISAEAPDPQDIAHLELDLSTDDAWQVLTSIFLTGRVPKELCSNTAERPSLRPFAPSPPRQLLHHAEVGESPASQRAATQRIGRNAPCPCGSGKKYKRCCGAAE